MYPAEAFRPTLSKLIDLLETAGIRFHLTGGIVSALYAEPRFTQDADVVIDRDATAAQVDSFIETLRSRQYEFDTPSVREAIEAGKLFQLLDLDEMLKIDVYPRELVEGELDRSVVMEVLPGVEWPVVSRTDLVLAKLVWISKGSHKSRQDVKQILLRATPQEMETVRRNAGGMSLSDLLDEVLAEPDEIDL